MNAIKRAPFILALALLGACGQENAEPQAQATATPASTTPASDMAASEVVTPSPSPSANAAPAAFAVCSSCHAVEPGRNLVGPSLAGVWGRKAGTTPGYAYSDALKNSGITWDRASVDQWLQGPMKMVPGTKMVISLSDASGRKAVIDYLETLK